MSMIINGKKSLLNVNLTLVEAGVKEPEKAYFFPTAFNTNGYPIKAKTIGVTQVPSYYINKSGSSHHILSQYLKELELNDGVTSIGSSAFYNANIQTIKNTKDLEYINAYAFIYCYYLKTISLPKIKSIGEQAFQQCTMFQRITDMPATPPTIQYNTFNSCDKLIIEIPQGSLSAYQNATNWSQHASKLVEV